MNVTLSVDGKLAEKLRKVAEDMGKSLNQRVRNYLEQLARPQQMAQELTELRRLSLEGEGNARGWRFNREELHERP